MGSNPPLKILYVVPYVPSRIRTRPFHFLKALTSEGHHVTLATLWSNAEEFGALRHLAKNLEDSFAEQIGVPKALWNCIRALPKSQPVQAYYSWHSRLARRLMQVLESREFDVIHIEHLRGVRYGLLLNEFLSQRRHKNPPVVWDSVDCISKLFRQAAQESLTLRSRLTARLELARTERFEGWLTTQFKRILVTSEFDRNALVELGTHWGQKDAAGPADRLKNRIAVVPNGVDSDYFSPNGEARDPLSLVITGKMSYHANVTSVVQFVKEVMPRVWDQVPETRLWIVGKDPAWEIRSLGVPWRDGQNVVDSGNSGKETRVQITSTVPDVRPFLRKASVAVAPVQYGVGVQNKVLEAMACETPVVASPQAVSALQVQPGRELIVTRNSKDVCSSLVSLLRNPEQRAQLGRAGRSFVRQRHDWTVIVRDLVQIYREAALET